MVRLIVDVICRWEMGRLEGELEHFSEEILVRDGEEFTQIWDRVCDYHGNAAFTVIDIQLSEFTREYFRHQGYDV